MLFIYIVLFETASLATIAHYYLSAGSLRLDLSPLVNAFQVSIGLLLLAASATTSLAEERARGSLDVILATPIATRAVVLGKWWATFRLVPVIAVLPCTLVFTMATREIRWQGAGAMFGLILSFGALTTSIGMACATWISRLGRSLTASILIFLGLTVGLVCIVSVLQSFPDVERELADYSKWIFAGLIVLVGIACFRSLRKIGRSAAKPLAIGFAGLAALFALFQFQPEHGGRSSLETYFGGIVMESCWYGPGELTALATRPNMPNSSAVWNSIGLWIHVNLIVSFVIMCVVLSTFDHCLGRAKDKSLPRLLSEEELSVLCAKGAIAGEYVRSRMMSSARPSKAGIGELAER